MSHNIEILERTARAVEAEFEDCEKPQYLPLHATRRFYHSLLLKLAATTTTGDWDRAAATARQQLRSRP
jgi:hypothetical protein